MWEHLNTPSITCSNDESFALNNWGVTLGIMIVSILLIKIVFTMLTKISIKIESDDEWRNIMVKMIGLASSVAVNKCDTRLQVKYSGWY